MVETTNYLEIQGLVILTKYSCISLTVACSKLLIFNLAKALSEHLHLITVSREATAYSGRKFILLNQPFY